jgi:hypothetical protein
MESCSSLLKRRLINPAKREQANVPLKRGDNKEAPESKLRKSPVI